MESQYNNVDTTLDIAGTWNGEAELCNGYVIILVYIKSSKRCTLKVRQSDNKSNYNFIETVEYLPITGEARYQIYRSSLYCYVEVINDSGEVIPDLIVRTHFLNIGRDSSIYYPTVVAGAVDVVNFPATQAVSGTVGVNNFPATQPVSGTVAVSSQPNLSYLTDNIAVATMPAITGTVAVSSQPNLSYLTDNIAVVTMPAITGTVAVSSQPHLSYLTDNIAIATQPALTFATDKVDVSGSSISISSGAITETNSGTISSTLTTLNNKVTACNTGAVVISSALPSGTNTIGKVYTYENPSFVANLTGLSDTGQTIKASAGSLFNLTCFNSGNAIAYIKIYNIAVPTASDTPIITLPILHDSPINTISIHNFQFSTAIGVRATANYIANDTSSPNGTTSIVAFYNGLAP